MGRFETGVMTQPDNLGSLVSLSGMWIDRVAERRPMTTVMLDMNSSVSPTFGDQGNTAYNGHFGSACCHPLLVFDQFGDLERCALRSGNVHSADGWHDVEPVVARYRNLKMRRFFRADAAFARRRRAMDQGRQECHAARSPPTPSGSCKRPADAGAAGRHREMVADQPAGEAREDRRKAFQPRPLHDLPDGGRLPYHAICSAAFCK